MSKPVDSVVVPFNPADPFERVARGLHHLGTQGQSLDWERATYYVDNYPDLEGEVLQEDPKLKGKRKAISREVNERLDKTHWKIYEQPTLIGRSFRSHTLQVHDLWPEVFAVNRKSCAYDHYMRIAICSLPSETKEELRAWIESGPVTQEQLRRRIRELVDERKGIYEPDFPVKYGNWWNFGRVESELGEFKGGIHPYVVANLLYYFTDPGDTVIDPMAGGDTTFRVTQTFKFFKKQDELLRFSGQRTVLRTDISPTNDGIEKADILEGLPWDDQAADFCLFDPPYYLVPDGYYKPFGESMADWCCNCQQALGQISRVLKPGGLVAAITDDYLRSDEFQPLSASLFEAATAVGFQPVSTIYNPYANFVATMDSRTMARQKKNRLLSNATKIIHVLSKPE